MIPLIDEKRQELTELCRRFHVRRLEVFGSAVTGKFRPETSDLDFLVDFEQVPPGELANSYFGLIEGLEHLFGRSVDLVTIDSIRNPYFRQSVEETRRLVYAA